jgi:hypothetical protein
MDRQPPSFAVEPTTGNMSATETTIITGASGVAFLRLLGVRPARQQGGLFPIEGEQIAPSSRSLTTVRA